MTEEASPAQQALLKKFGKWKDGMSKQEASTTISEHLNSQEIQGSVKKMSYSKPFVPADKFPTSMKVAYAKDILIQKMSQSALKDFDYFKECKECVDIVKALENGFN